jgi:serine/threonine protein kinase
LHGSGGTLADILSAKPAWWTPTAKVKAVMGIALALRFSHGLGLLHGGLNSGNVFFDGDRRVQIADFSPSRRDGGFSGEGEEWSPQADVSAFAMLLFEIIAGRPLSRPSDAMADTEVIVPPDIPSFVSEIIEGGLRPRARRELSFIAIIETLKRNHFRIVSGVDSEEVSAFVSRIEGAAESGDSE